MTQDRPSYQKDLAAILKKAQGRVDAEYGEPIHVGDEVARLRDTLDQLSKVAKASEAQQAEAEPVAYGLKNMVSGKWDGRTMVQANRADEYDDESLLPLYTTPPAPAPVVPDPLDPEDLEDSIVDCGQAAVNTYLRGWNECRQAMLSAAQEQPAEQERTCRWVYQGAAGFGALWSTECDEVVEDNHHIGDYCPHCGDMIVEGE